MAGKEPQLKYLYYKTGCMSPFHNNDKGLSVGRQIKVKVLDKIGETPLKPAL